MAILDLPHTASNISDRPDLCVGTIYAKFIRGFIHIITNSGVYSAQRFVCS